MKAKAILILFLTLTIQFPIDAKVHEKPAIPLFAKAATDIVVATEGNSIDGQLIVLESLKGELKPGDSLTIPELEGFNSQEARAIGDLDLIVRGDIAKAEVQYVTCSRMILFLRRNPARVNATYGVIAEDLPLWIGIGDLSIYQSIVWVEGERTYGLYDVNTFNGMVCNERGTLADLEESEAEIKRKLEVIIGKRE
jgi:hypothetical protein